ncbi:hypothetical protein L2E82_39072 [Cichorium intybus]|uniref:Uncharacterized protein n=1 Tax=Cichorium intybus TaxID=13427 RepID=A0ACB9AGG8_CICIN|nr:hypothetical protein L2E82_39072 [Cichorium intybus]
MVFQEIDGKKVIKERCEYDIEKPIGSCPQANNQINTNETDQWGFKWGQLLGENGGSGEGDGRFRKGGCPSLATTWSGIG